jgi:hypothetical protein
MAALASPAHVPAGSYSDDLTVRAARALYFERNGFGDGGYTDRWVTLRAGPIAIRFPNTKARVAAVKLHDVHHTATGYGTTWTGEAEIGAWEIASGCARHHAAWLLNLQAMGIGLLIAPRRLFRAFVRGRHSRNLYRAELDDALLDAPLGTVRRGLGLDREPPAADPGDVLCFLGWAAAGLATLAATAALAVAPLVALGWAAGQALGR